MKVLVTGAAGFSGQRMMEVLSHQGGITPVGFIRQETPETIQNPVVFKNADLLEKDRLNTVISEISPDAVLHLAGLTHGTQEALHATNVKGTDNLLEAVLAANPGCRILVISSSAVYGYAGESPISETAPIRPVSEYGRSKAEQETISLHYAGEGAAVAIARPFNLAGPGQTDAFICGRIVNQIVEIERGERESLELWEISSSRDLIDVRDAVRGYWALVSHEEYSQKCSGESFNLGSGNAYRISTIINTIEKITGEHYPIRLPETPPDIAIPTQQSNNSRITTLTGWKPVIPLADTLRDMLEAARKKKG